MLRLFFMLSIIFVITGMLWLVLNRAGMGHLPGDFFIRSGSFTLHVPLTTSLIYAAVVTCILRLLQVRKI